MSPSHAPRRAQVVFVEPAIGQIDKLTERETHALDRALVAVSVRPDIGTLRSDAPVRDYRDEVEGVRVIYFATALQRIVVAVYIEA
ncbi:hypothetical protein [Kitasatospora sp. GP82]|uniref:hypothetical protein n=1 Tax=Kitasatospora sp. GP82 TaxID=3035089 RepID=UPI0024742737|nr:hypothetical protein [Kitasatospora sp. GP82]MDH6130044.1 hypothetical protein [Kitasatospora sp. GP82]